jgi:hypothetical protein
MRQKKKIPASGGTLDRDGITAADRAAGKQPTTPAERAQTAAALLLPRRASDRYQVVYVYRSPRGGERAWMVQWGEWPPFTIRYEQLISRTRFLNVAHNALGILILESDEPERLVDLAVPEKLAWQAMTKAVVAGLMRGAA